MLNKVKLTEAEMREFAEVFAYYDYGDEEIGMVPYYPGYPDRTSLVNYLVAMIRTANEYNGIYSTSDNKEGILILTDTTHPYPGVAMFKMLWRMARALGFRDFGNIVKKFQAGGASLEKSYRDSRKQFVQIELLAVKNEYQGKGFMRPLVETAFEVAKLNNLPVIVSTDARLKKDKYAHIGMKHINTRTLGEKSFMYAYYESAANMNNTIIEYVNGMEVVKVFNKDGDSYKRFGDVVRSYRDFTLDWYKVCWPWMAIYSSVLPCLVLLMLPFGSMMVLGGTLALDKMVLVFCMSFAVGPSVLKALNFAGKFPQLDYKIAELEKMMEHPPLKEGTNGFKGETLDVEFKDVHFGYEDTEVIHGVNLSLKQGTTTALVGESGSGKSTLAKLLVHYYDLDSGTITIGGQDITDMSIEALNDQVAFVSQEQFLFNTSLYENILIGKPDATKEEVLKAAERAQCNEFIERLPDGIETQAGDGGKQLSGGERQRISLARAILKNAPIIVLDEATAFMDPENEEKMNAALDEIVKDKTVLVIAHRLSTIKNANKICVMKEGKCIAADIHDKLVDNCPEYKKLWDASVSASTWKVREA